MESDGLGRRNNMDKVTLEREKLALENERRKLMNQKIRGAPLLRF